MPASTRGKKRKTGLLVLGLLAVLGSAAWLFGRPAPAPPPVVLHPTTHEVAETEKHLAGLSQAVAKPGRSPRTIHLSEDDINVALSGSPSLRKLLAAHAVQAVQVVLSEPDGVIIHAAVLVRGHPQNILIGGTLAPDPKLGIRFTASGAQVGRLPIPAPVVTAEANALAARLSRLVLGRLSISVLNVSVQKKELVIVGIPTAPASPPSASLQPASPARH